MLRVRLGLRVGPFIVTRRGYTRPRSTWTPGDRLIAVAFTLALPAGMLLGWWISR